MMVVRSAQRAAMARQRFLPRGVAHAARLFPEACRALGPEGLRELVGHALERAMAHGLDRERDVLRYLAVMMTFGRDFDVDPAHPWAREVLGSTGEDRGARLVARARAARGRTT